MLTFLGLSFRVGGRAVDMARAILQRVCCVAVSVYVCVLMRSRVGVCLCEDAFRRCICVLPLRCGGSCGTVCAAVYTYFALGWSARGATSCVLSRRHCAVALLISPLWMLVLTMALLLPELLLLSLLRAAPWCKCPLQGAACVSLAVFYGTRAMDSSPCDTARVSGFLCATMCC